MSASRLSRTPPRPDSHDASRDRRAKADRGFARFTSLGEAALHKNIENNPMHSSGMTNPSFPRIHLTRRANHLHHVTLPEFGRRISPCSGNRYRCAQLPSRVSVDAGQPHHVDPPREICLCAHANISRSWTSTRNSTSTPSASVPGASSAPGPIDLSRPLRKPGRDPADGPDDRRGREGRHLLDRPDARGAGALHRGARISPGAPHTGQRRPLHVFSGRRWNNEIYPLLRDFVHVNS